jgi:hypothetical protein
MFCHYRRFKPKTNVVFIILLCFYDRQQIHIIDTTILLLLLLTPWQHVNNRGQSGHDHLIVVIVHCRYFTIPTHIIHLQDLFISDKFNNEGQNDNSST